MDKAAEQTSPTKMPEAVAGPSTEGFGKSPISRKILFNKEDKSGKNKTRNKQESGMANLKKLEEQRTTASYPLTTQKMNTIVMNYIQKMGKGNGVTFKDISKYLEENYKLDMNLFDPCVKMTLNRIQKMGILWRSGPVTDIRYSIKQSGNVKEAAENLLLKEKMDAPKPESKSITGKATNHFPTSQYIPSRNQAAEVTSVIENLEGAPTPMITEVAGATNITEILEGAPTPIITEVAGTTNVTENLVAAPIPSTAEVAGATNATKKLEAATISSIRQVAKETSLKKSIANGVSIKRTRDTKSKIQNKKPKIANAGATKFNLVSATESKNLKRKASHPKTSEMVMDAIKSLKKRNGATLDDISKHMDENQQVNMKVFKPHVKKFLMKSVESGSLEQLSGADEVERYKFKKPENVGKKVAK